MVALLALAMLGPTQTGAPQFHAAPPPEIKRLSFLTGAWDAHLRLNWEAASLHVDLQGKIDGTWDMGGHFLILRGTTRLAGGRSMRAEGRFSYDRDGRIYRGFLFFEGLATGWSLRGSFHGKELVLTARGIDADYPPIKTRILPQAAGMVEVRFAAAENPNPKDVMRLTLRRRRG